MAAAKAIHPRLRAGGGVETGLLGMTSFGGLNSSCGRARQRVSNAGLVGIYAHQLHL